ncbi:MAG: polyamine aminopropyltransferase [Oscillospiraceae bacterium]|nr:polyamine aminopropyltransferase [Oscillospiraceae bacterium]
MLDLWYTENHTPDVRFSIRVKEHLVSYKSEFQQIDVFDSDEYGRFMTLDGLLMVTEKDEYVYHEMITHIPMATNPEIKNILVIGAGDGGTVRELCRYKTIENIDMVEIDKAVVDISREYMPFTACSLDDPRVNIYYQDGLRFVRHKENEYDLIIVDSTDPFGVGECLFTKEFYGNCHNALKKDGILINQHESVFYKQYADSMKRAHSRIKTFFSTALCYQTHIPSYPSGHWLFGFASDTFDPRRDLKEEYWNSLGLKTKYYNTTLHKGCFAIPNNVRDALREEVKEN